MRLPKHFPKYLLLLVVFCTGALYAQVDPGPATPTPPVSPCGVGMPSPLPNVSQDEVNFFCAALKRFQEIDSVSGIVHNADGTCSPNDRPGVAFPCNEPGGGLGARFNGNSCAMCHIQPVVLGASPATNPEVAVATLDGAQNSLMPLSAFINSQSAIKEVRFIRNLNTGQPDGNVHSLFVISGRIDATNANNMNGLVTTCDETQPDFATNVAANNVVFRIPIQTQGDGLVELIDDEDLEDAVNAVSGQMGVSGMFNRSGNDATITRFGWKAQNKSLLMFAGEAYNVEQGVTNELFPNERQLDTLLLGQSDWQCQFFPVPNDTTNLTNNFNTNSPASDFSSDTVNFAAASRLSDIPQRQTNRFALASINNGQSVFDSIGCNLCHTHDTTNQTVIPRSSMPSNQNYRFVPMFSDLALHHMGMNLQDNISQGLASGDQFRSAPLWGLGARLFLLHDGRTQDLVNAITQHMSAGSEANTVVNNFLLLGPTQKQDLLNFLRSL